MYLDPGFGSMIIQGIVAAIAAGGAYLILIRKKIVAFVKAKQSAQNATEGEEKSSRIEE